MFFPAGSSSSPGGGGGDPRRRPLTPAGMSPPFCPFNMGALCWVLPLEEDEEMLEEEVEEEEDDEEDEGKEKGSDMFPGVGLVERIQRLLDEAVCCLGSYPSADSLVLLVNRAIESCLLGFSSPDKTRISGKTRRGFFICVEF